MDTSAAPHSVCGNGGCDFVGASSVLADQVGCGYFYREVWGETPRRFSGSLCRSLARRLLTKTRTCLIPGADVRHFQSATLIIKASRRIVQCAVAEILSTGSAELARFLMMLSNLPPAMSRMISFHTLAKWLLFNGEKGISELTGSSENKVNWETFCLNSWFVSLSSLCDVNSH
ncbi:hypothetical protein HJG60_009433 [Phyllostomus discolor]|uniref:Uncharacterized protein n=1 Tax=Phyllostomus discolor TaxID=89673 RepID=A0A833Y918_9CHIR|nr:hypothetical protein HJG60_009433 [Phyllostomus discolor]